VFLDSTPDLYAYLIHLFCVMSTHALALDSQRGVIARDRFACLASGIFEIIIVLFLVLFLPIYRLPSPLKLLSMLGFLGIRTFGFCVLLRLQIREMKAHLLDNERLR